MPKALNQKSVVAKSTRVPKYVYRVSVGITPELGELMRDYMRTVSAHEIRLVLFEALSAYVQAREPGWKSSGGTSVFAPNVRLDVVPGQSHWQNHRAVDDLLANATQAAQALAEKEAPHD